MGNDCSTWLHSWNGWSKVKVTGFNYDLDGDGTGDHGKNTSINISDISLQSDIKDIFTDQIQISDPRASHYIDKYIKLEYRDKVAFDPYLWKLKVINKNTLEVKIIFP